MGYSDHHFAYVDPHSLGGGGGDACGSSGVSSADVVEGQQHHRHAASQALLSILPRSSRVLISGNNRTKRALVGQVCVCAWRGVAGGGAALVFFGAVGKKRGANWRAPRWAAPRCDRRARRTIDRSVCLSTRRARARGERALGGGGWWALGQSLRSRPPPRPLSANPALCGRAAAAASGAMADADWLLPDAIGRRRVEPPSCAHGRVGALSRVVWCARVERLAAAALPHQASRHAPLPTPCRCPKKQSIPPVAHPQQQEAIVKKAVGLGGWHWLVLGGGEEVKLQRNALTVLEYGSDDAQVRGDCVSAFLCVLPCAASGAGLRARGDRRRRTPFPHQHP